MWDSAYAHVDYAVHGVGGRLDEVVECVRLKAVVRFGHVPGGARSSLPSSPAKSAGPSPTKNSADEVPVVEAGTTL
jgi:hypothetical protein